MMSDAFDPDEDWREVVDPFHRLMSENADLRAHIDTLTADLARVTAERDALMEVIGSGEGVRYSAITQKYWTTTEGPGFQHDTLDKAIRVLAGIDPNGGPDCTTDPTS
jgi:hypothetical protein